MKKTNLLLFAIMCSLVAFSQEIPHQISFQGKLIENESPVNDVKNMTFTLGTWNETQDVQVINGYYSVSLGAINPIPLSLIIENNVLELEIKIDGAPLYPNTKIKTVPYAYKAEYAVNTDNIAGYQIVGTPQLGEILKYDGTQWIPSTDNEGTGIDDVNAGGDLSGTYPNPTVAKLQGKTVATTTPTTGQVLKYNGTQWIPDTDVEGTGSIDGTVAAGDLSGTYPNPTVAKLQGKTVATTTPTTGQVLKYNGTQWIPDTDVEGTGSIDGTVAAGDLSGTYPNPTVAKLQGKTVATTTPTTGQVLKYNGTQWIPDSDNGGSTWSLVDNNLTYSNGSVGIGPNMDSPQFPLHVVSSQASIKLGVGHFTNTVINTDGAGVSGTCTASDFYGYGGYFIGGYCGVVGKVETESNISSQSYCGVIGTASSSNNATLYGVYGKTNGGGPDSYAGYFLGDVYTTGSVSKSSSKTIIDNPINPTNEILAHSTIESNEMLNVYSGNAVLNENGEVIVDLPDWLEALNTEYRYQLTCVGGFANVYIAKEIENNRFTIAGGKPNLKVSWQVTGVRNDPYAKANPMEVIKEKNSEEKGYYLHPKAYNQPVEKGISYLHEKDNLEKDMEEVNHENE